VEISSDRLVTYPPIGLQISEDDADAMLFPPALGYKKNYTVNELNLMGQGDVLLLFTDGLMDPFSSYNKDRLERAVSRVKEGTAREICEKIFEDRIAAQKPDDDISLVVIKYR
jgi:serine phosphatase RsbU (regulator of sigma subunit)